MNQPTQYIDVESFGNAMKEVGKMIATTLNGIIEAFKRVAEAVSFSLIKPIFSKKIKRKRFIKLLMSYGIQRNEANKIANYYHKKDGYYLLTNVYSEVTEWKKNTKKY